MDISGKLTVSQLTDLIRRALEGCSVKEGWEVLVRRAMQADNSWGRSANAYIKLYKSLISNS